MCCCRLPSCPGVSLSVAILLAKTTMRYVRTVTITPSSHIELVERTTEKSQEVKGPKELEFKEGISRRKWITSHL